MVHVLFPAVPNSCGDAAGADSSERKPCCQYDHGAKIQSPLNYQSSQKMRSREHTLRCPPAPPVLATQTSHFVSFSCHFPTIFFIKEQSDIYGPRYRIGGAAALPRSGSATAQRAWRSRWSASLACFPATPPHFPGVVGPAPPSTNS